MTSIRRALLNDFEALGTKWWIDIFEDNPDFSKIQIEIIRTIRQFELDYSRFKTTSKISQLNVNRYYDSPSEEMRDLLFLGKSLFALTGGNFNVLMGNLLVRQGYGQISFRESTLPGNPESDLLISDEKIVLLGNADLDLGGFAKGYLIDKIGRILTREYGLKYFIINGGGDILVTSDHNHDIALWLQVPNDTKSFVGKISVQNTAFAASSPYQRTWQLGNHQVNHLINPSDTKSEVTCSTFVLSPYAALADAIATTLAVAEGKLDTIPNELLLLSTYCVIKGSDLTRSERFPEIT